MPSLNTSAGYYPYAPIPSTSGFGVGFGYLNTLCLTGIFGALGLNIRDRKTIVKYTLDRDMYVVHDELFQICSFIFYGQNRGLRTTTVFGLPVFGGARQIYLLRATSWRGPKG